MNQSTNENLRCDNCRFFDVKHYDQNNPQMTGLGQCRRRPMGVHSSTGAFQIVWVDDWCGGFEEAVQPAP